MASWEHFYHTADIGVRGTGATLAQAFEQIALALTAVVLDPGSLSTRELISIQVSAPDPELLLFEWLNALIYEMSVRAMLFNRFEVVISGRQLNGRVWGEAIDMHRHRPTVEIKGATFTALQVRRTETGLWLAQCVVDV